MFESRMGPEALHLGSSANPTAMRGLRSFAGISRARAACPGMTECARFAHLVLTPVLSLAPKAEVRQKVRCVLLLIEKPWPNRELTHVTTGAR